MPLDTQKQLELIIFGRPTFMAHTYTHTHIHTFTHTRTHTYTRSHTYTQLHIHIPRIHLGAGVLKTLFGSLIFVT
jgi:hypothetical protein